MLINDRPTCKVASLRVTRQFL